MENKELVLADFGASDEELHAEMAAAGKRVREKNRGNNNPPPVVHGTPEIHPADLVREYLRTN